MSFIPKAKLYTYQKILRAKKAKDLFKGTNEKNRNKNKINL